MGLIGKLLGEKCYICRRRGNINSLEEVKCYEYYGSVYHNYYHDICYRHALEYPEVSGNVRVDRALCIGQLIEKMEDREGADQIHRENRVRNRRIYEGMEQPEPETIPEPIPDDPPQLVTRPRRGFDLDG